MTNTLQTEAYKRLIVAILLSLKEERGESIINFAHSKWCRELCEGVDLNYWEYRVWAEKKGADLRDELLRPTGSTTK